MKARLQIQNFGPIRYINIDISKFNILIGPHAAGKSTISKVLSIIHSFEFLLEPIADDKTNSERLSRFLVFYRIESFLKPDTYWNFEDDVFSFEYKSGHILVRHKTNVEHTTDQTECYYFPAERVALPMINESLFELISEQSSLPGYFLQFGKDFTIARKNQRMFNISVLDVEFEYVESKNNVIFQNQKSLLLQETSSAIQATLPLLVILQYPIKNASLFVIEELELHSFPQLQKKMLYYIVERMQLQRKLNKAYVILPTHSPYLLSAANNLLLASKVGKSNKVEVEKIINASSWIDVNDLSAFYINNGEASSIVDQETGMIHENSLDNISEDLAGEFDALMELYKPAKA